VINICHKCKNSDDLSICDGCSGNSRLRDYFEEKPLAPLVSKPSKVPVKAKGWYMRTGYKK